MWNKLAEMGVLGLTVPADFGGFGEGPASQLVVQRELGRGLVLEPVTPSGVMAAAILAAHGSAAQKEEWLPAIASGERIVTLAYLEPTTRYRPESARASARRSGDGYVLNGIKSVVWHGAAADAYLLTARVAGSNEIALFLVPRDSKGLGVTAYPTIDGLRAADLSLQDVTVPASALVGEPADGLAALGVGLEHGVAALCAEGAGAMEKLIEITAEYLGTRQQFRQAAGQLPGTAAPHGRHAGAEGTGAVDGLRRSPGAGRGRSRRAPPHAVRGQGDAGPCRTLRRPAGRAAAWRHGHDG